MNTGQEEVTHQEKSQHAHTTKLIDYIIQTNYNSEKALVIQTWPNISTKADSVSVSVRMFRS